MAGRSAGISSAVRWAAAGVVCTLVVALTGLTGSVPAVALSASGHWLYNHTIGAVVHVDGSTKQVDARVPVAGASPAEQVTEDRTNGYLVDPGRARIVRFGKSTLRVSGTVASGSTSRPDIVRTASGTYLFFADTHKIFRLGEDATTFSVASEASSPVATTGGTVWFLLPADARVCRIAPHATTVECPVELARNHVGRLAVLDDRPAFLDLTASAIVPVSDDGAARPVRLPVRLPTDALLAASDAGGRLPVVVPDAGASRLVLLDTSTVRSGRPAARPIERRLAAGSYDAPIAAGGSIVLVDQKYRTITSYDVRGARRGSVTDTGAGALRATRGDDGRVYVDNATGSRTTVVDGDGRITPVDTTSGGRGKLPTPSPSPSRSSDGPTEAGRSGTPGRSPGPGTGTPTPATDSSTSGSGSTPGRGRPGRPAPGGTSTRTAADNPTPGTRAPEVVVPTPTRTTRPRVVKRPGTRPGRTRDRSTSAPRTPSRPSTPTRERPRAGVPGVPPSVTVDVRSGGKAVVDWTTPAANRAVITAYRVVLRSGDARITRRVVAARKHRTALTGLKPGRYVVTVAARNRVGWSAARESRPFKIATPPPTGSCRSAVLADDPMLAYDLGTGSGRLVTDISGHDHLGVDAGLSSTGQAGPCGATSLGLSGTAGLVTTGETFQSPSAFTAEVWFRTNSSHGGALIGFGTDRSDDARYDRAVYLTDDGHVVFGAYNNRVCVAPSPRRYDDDRWHLVAASLGPDGMRLYVDGRLVASDRNTGLSMSYAGRWNFGWTSLAGAPNRPSTDFFAGNLALAAVWDRQLTPAQLAKHYRTP